MSPPSIYTVVLTGGIASGKSAVSRLFASLGVAVVDTDAIAHEIVQAGRPALRQIVSEFGREYLKADGELDRAKMRDAVFSDARKRARLEAILHPRIGQEALRRVREARGLYCMVVIPLYAESARWPWIDRVLVVDTDEKSQIERLIQRDQISAKQAESILAVQATRQTRLAIADDVICNSGTLEDLVPKVEALHQKYRLLASRASRK